MTLGVILVSYNTGAVFFDCIESLLSAARASGAPDLRVLVVDNDSPDGTVARLKCWALEKVGQAGTDLPFEPRPRGPVTLNLRDLQVDGRHETPWPKSEELDYIPGCHMMVSRAFLDRAGMTPEEYFLYFEEIDWAMRRDGLPLLWVADAPIHHHSGASIGSQTLGVGSSPLVAYWMFRNRLRFVRRWNPKGLPTAIAYSAGKVAQLYRQGHGTAARAAWRGMTGRSRT